MPCGEPALGETQERTLGDGEKNEESLTSPDSGNPAPGCADAPKIRGSEKTGKTGKPGRPQSGSPDRATDQPFGISGSTNWVSSASDSCHPR